MAEEDLKTSSRPAASSDSLVGVERVDLNADAGESEDSSTDEALLDFVTSVSLACGVHAGSPAAIASLSAKARAKGVGVGAHPGLPEGRKPRIISPMEAEEAVRIQIETFRKHSQAPLQHAKPHGALYHAARDPRVAKAVAEAVRELGVPILVAQAGSPLERAAKEAGVRVVAEAFLDRAYEPDGRLVARGRPGAILEDAGEAGGRALDIVLRNRLFAVNGREVAVRAGTLCVHSDNPAALAIARVVRPALEEAGVVVRPMGDP